MGLGDRIRDMDLVKEMTVPMFAVCMYASLGGMSFGIDYNYWGGLLGMDQFKRDYGVWSDADNAYILPSSWQSAGSGTPIAGLAFGALCAGVIGARLGRIRTFQISGVLSVIGIIIQAAAIRSYWQLVVGRIVNAVALGILANAVPTYQAECAPSAIRGTLVNCYQFSLGVGAVLANTSNWGTHQRADQWAYRIIIILQLLVPAVLLTGSMIVPESPRWLIRAGRDADALKVLLWLRKRKGTPAAVVEQEVGLLALAEEERKQTSNGAWLECFQGIHLRRTLIVTGVQCLQQAQGNSFMSSYAVVFLQQIGIGDTYKIQVLLIFVFAISCGFAFYFPDKLGRRSLMIGCSILMASSMFTVSGIAGFGGSDNETAMKGALAMLFVWWFFSSLGWSSCVWIVTAEVPTLQLREKTIMTGTFLGFCVSVIVTFVSPYLQDAGYGNLGGRVGFVYGGFSVVAAIWCFFFLPETRGRSLEELDELFEARVSVWRFARYKTTGAGAQLAEMEHATAHGDSLFERGLKVIDAVDEEEGRVLGAVPVKE